MTELGLIKQTSLPVIEDQLASYGNGVRVRAFQGDDREKEWNTFKSQVSPERQVWQWKSENVGKDGLYCYLNGFCILEKGQVVSLFELIPTCQQTK